MTTTVGNVVKKVHSIIDGIRNKYGYKWTDFIRVIHIADTDGAFSKNSVIKSDAEEILYFEDHIESANVATTEQRNKHKSEIMHRLSSTGRVHGITYSLYFNSCNLEHVLYKELKNFSDEEKEDMADDFAEEYDGKVDEFVNFISNEELAVPGSFNETWKFIEKDNHSLERHSNMHLIFWQEVVCSPSSIQKNN